MNWYYTQATFITRKSGGKSEKELIELEKEVFLILKSIFPDIKWFGSMGAKYFSDNFIGTFDSEEGGTFNKAYIKASFYCLNKEPLKLLKELEDKEIGSFKTILVHNGNKVVELEMH